MSVAFEPFDREAFRKRLAKMTDSELIQFGKAAGEIVSERDLIRFLGAFLVTVANIVQMIPQCASQDRGLCRAKSRNDAVVADQSQCRATWRWPG
jgi:hypothetical protein